ncbi:hypothetical protein NGM10_14375 [Halorussus salilacus]|uniref:DUF7344 domain-containing protein n=1 Tax=Halorussus salilacus TaxID=2953750 RepID=UPI00209CC5B4|nr:hypothetical protein [Halorussus salilacus]USZ67905.1 hypothetical protein NGM10_14375 [Halorussus salilacus]
MTAERGRSLARPGNWERSKPTVVEAVLNRRRRYALYYLRERAGPVDLDDLVRQVAAWEAGKTPGEVARADRVAVGASLRETHLPFLAQRNIVRYDPHCDRATYCATDPALAVYLENDPRTAVRWHRVYLLLTAVVAVFVGLVWVGVGPFARVNPLAVAAVAVALFAAASVGHWYDVYRWRRRTEDLPPDFVVEFEEDADGRNGESASSAAADEADESEEGEEGDDGNESEEGDDGDWPR